ncbi:MAG: single-stranded-DNA-specific exonuclease RecJ [Flavobacteriia bacterium]|nr:MAG: single-stranded-DNA-specific exonuclease RecJ [Flavobacteriia bacterium]
MRWEKLPSPEKEKVNQLAEELKIDKYLSKILVQRGVETFDQARKFFKPTLDDLYDPFLMKDMDKAVSRIEKAIENNENILIYGDYDVDGTTAVTLVSTFLKNNYPKVATYIPDRYREGYGISFTGIDFAHDNDISLVIALDCGIKANDKIDYANKKNIDFIICDHHRPGDKLPEAVAVLDPKRDDCQYPFKELPGCGIGFKLIQAMAEKKGETIHSLLPYLDLVVTAIAADIVPLTDENRVLATFGLQVINANPRPGIRAITEQMKKDILTITDVVFQIAPRINAAGRMKHGLYAVELLSERNYKKALEYAKAIEVFNSDRKDLDKEITKEALIQIEGNQEEKNYSTVVCREEWHKGVIGIVASRLIEKYYRPTIVFTLSGDKLTGSARSVKGFDIYDAIEKCSEYIEQFGGHKYAAGLTILPENYTLFKNKFEEVVKESISEEMLIPQITIDSEIPLHEITPKFLRILKRLGPFGPRNMKPVFESSGLRDNGYGKTVGNDGDHLKLSIIKGSDTNTYQAIGFGLGYKYPLIKNGLSFKAAFTIEENHWNGMTNLQLNIKDIKKEK